MSYILPACILRRKNSDIVEYYMDEHCTLQGVVKLLQERYLEAASLLGRV